MRLIFTFIITYLASTSYGQTEKFFGKAYRNPKGYFNNQHFIETTFVFRKNHGYDIFGYKLMSAKKRIKKKELNHAIWIVTDGKILYLNSERHGFVSNFIKLNLYSKFYYFEAEPVLTPIQQHRVQKAQFDFGLIGSTTALRKADKENSWKRHNVLNIQDGRTYILNEDYISKILIEYPELLKQFMAETNKNEIETLKYYLNLINDYEFNSSATNSGQSP